MKTPIIILMLLVISTTVSAIDAPPSIPLEVWGPIISGNRLSTTNATIVAVVEGTEISESVAANGKYRLTIVGDNPLTDPLDPLCNVHYSRREACVPCTNNCIEGPSEEKSVLLKASGVLQSPGIEWKQGVRLFPIVLDQTLMRYTLQLKAGRNIISIPLIPFENRWSNILANCPYKRIWEFQKDKTWKSSDTGLSTMIPTKGYIIEKEGNDAVCNIPIDGAKIEKIRIPITGEWNLISYPCPIAQAISNLNHSLWTSIWELSNGWVSTSSGLDTLIPGKGYWVYSNTTGTFEVEC